MNSTPLPVTVISGFTGAGKSALVDAMLANDEGVRVGAVSVAHEADPVEAIERDIAALAEQQRFDAILVELPPFVNPLDIAEQLAFGDDEQATLGGQAVLDTFVTVIDAASFLRDYASTDSLAQRGLASHDDAHDEGRTVVESLIEQIEFCDVIVINKIDLVDEEALETLASILHALNPRALQVPTQSGKAPIADVLDTNRFDLDNTASAPGWLAILNDEHPSNGEPDASGVGHLVYRARRPFHPQRLWELLHREWTDVLRAKGFFWLATRSEVGGALSQAGGTLRHGPAGVWWAAQDRSEWPTDDPELEADIVAEWFGDPDDNSVGDRRQELVLIGLDLDVAAWDANFDACLLTDEEWLLGSDGWRHLNDPFPAWDIDDHEHEHGDDDHEHGPDCGCDGHTH
jgi:G3E family GTPase